MGFLERLAEQDYQFLIVDPEGIILPSTALLFWGTMNGLQGVCEVLDVLAKPEKYCKLFLGTAGTLQEAFISSSSVPAGIASPTDRTLELAVDNKLFATTWCGTASTEWQIQVLRRLE